MIIGAPTLPLTFPRRCRPATIPRPPRPRWRQKDWPWEICTRGPSLTVY